MTAGRPGGVKLGATDGRSPKQLDGMRPGRRGPASCRFDADMAQPMHLRDVPPRVACPYVMADGEFEERYPLDDALGTCALVEALKEIRFSDRKLYPLGVRRGSSSSRRSVAWWGG